MRAIPYLLGCLGALWVVLAPQVCMADTLQDFEFTDLLTGTRHQTAQYRGYEMVLMFGSMYCGPCKALLPVLHAFAADNRERMIVVLSVDLDSSSEAGKVLAYYREHGLSLPVFLDQERQLSRRYKVYMLPSLMFVGADGTVHSVLRGPKPRRVVDRELAQVRDRARLRSVAQPPPCREPDGEE